MLRVDIKPENFRWMRERANMNVEDLIRHFPKYADWEAGALRPTFKQLEKLARTVHAPIGYFFLSEQVEERVPIPDFRTVGSTPLRRPSPDLLDTVYLCQQRQDWYQDFALRNGQESLEFVGSATIQDDVEQIATEIRDVLEFDPEERSSLTTWTEALRHLVQVTEGLGVLVMMSGIVSNNTHRKLDPGEFRGFALADEFAPLIFVNAADTKAAQMFTLAHQLAYLWLGETALSNSCLDAVPAHQVEAWCSSVAAELLVPLASLRKDYQKRENLTVAIDRLARRFKVSTLVILRRIQDLGDLTQDEFRTAYDAELKKLKLVLRSGEGDFYSSQSARVGHRFARAVVISTLEGGTSFTESFRMLGFRKTRTFDKLARRLGIVS